MIFASVFFQKGIGLNSGGSVVIEKQYLIGQIARSSHSQVLKNLLNSGKLYEIYFLGI